MSFAEALLDWFDENRRDLPWRKTKNPYLIWLSEIILQQTQVIQGLNYYLRFAEKYPTVKDLAQAQESDILKLWQGLGYYSRARNLYQTAQVIVNQYQEIFPDNYSEIKKLKGIGDYTAAAISSIAYNLPYPAIDGNVMRVISRIFGIKLPINSKEGLSQIKTSLNQVFDTLNPGEFNQAMMEFGAIQCTPKHPDCSVCIFQTSCYAFNNESIEIIPFKIKTIKIKKRFLVYFLIKHKTSILLHLRDHTDIWKSLYDFPMIETSKPVNYHQIQKLEIYKDWFQNGSYQILNFEKSYKQKLTHQNLNIQFFAIESAQLTLNDKFFWIDIQDFKNYAVPKIIHRFGQEFHLL